MGNSILNSRKLAKNTILLYIRFIFTMLVSLYTSRVILKYLGVEDYGIYNVVGGVVAMFQIVSSSLSSSVSRHLTFELGKGNSERLSKMFVMSINIQLLLIVVLFLLLEPLGFWFIGQKLVIPESRLFAAYCVFQFSMITFAINLLGVPYIASIISHERMKAFAYIGILDVCLKLIIVYLLVISPIDKLIFYGFFHLLVALIICMICGIYCKNRFAECTYYYCFDKEILKIMFGFATWNFLGCTATLLKNQGLNILLNIFFGPVVNAARAISTQVNSAVNGFVSNFMTALTPQITKAYAQDDNDYLLNCIYKGSKFSFFLLYFLSLPLLIETEEILKLWLVDVPDSTVGFVRYILIFSLADTLSRTTINANNATGNIKKYQITIGTFNLLILPFAYFVIKLGCRPETTELISVVFTLISLFPRIYFVKKNIPITYLDFIFKVILPVLFVSCMGLILPLIIKKNIAYSVINLIFIVCVSFFSAFICIITFGCTKMEKKYLKKMINKYICIR